MLIDFTNKNINNGKNSQDPNKCSDKNVLSYIPRLVPKLSFAIALYLFLSNVMATEVVLQDVKIVKVGETNQIEIGLGRPLGYVKHFPQTFGEIIQIQLSLDADHARLIHKEVKQGAELQPPRGQKPILIYVTYEEGVPGGPYLTLRFVRPMNFIVEAKSDTSLLVTVRDKVEEKKDSTAAGAEIPGTVSEQPAKPKDRSARKKLNVGELMAKARQALTFGDNEGSARLLRKIISIPDNPHAQEARELLGLSLERSKQIPRAKFEYQKYLELYKKGDGPKRVKQRLQALENLGIVQKRKKLRVTKRDRKTQSYKFFGRLAQDAGLRLAIDDSDEVEASGEEQFIKSRRHSHHLTVRGRYQTGNRVINSALTGSYSWSRAGTRESRERERLSDAYIQATQGRDMVFGTLGLQRARNAGVYQRFWGASGGFKPVDWLTLSLLGGQPDLHDVSYDKDFYALKAGIGKRRAKMSGNVYMVNQEVDGLRDREAVGGDMRFSEKTVTLYTSLDYDTLFKQPTLGSVRWGWQYNKKSRLNVSYDYRALSNTSNLVNKITPVEKDSDNPNHTASVQFLPLTTMAELRNIIPEEDLYLLASLYTTKSHNFTIGSSIQYDKDNQINLDVSMYKTDATPTADLTAYEGRSDEIYGDGNLADTIFVGLVGQAATQDNRTITASAQLIASNAWMEKDLHVIGMRVSRNETGGEETSRDISVFMNSRLPPWNKINPRPRINISYREFKNTSVNQGSRWFIAPTIKLDYRWKKELVFDVELGYDYLHYPDDTGRNQQNGSARIGYNYTF